jgi:8-oxo-dGTP diphosphatase
LISDARDGARAGLPLVYAAGGLLWRGDAGEARLAIVHRPRYDDWVLPKGKLDEGEAFPATALREVREETGCDARLEEFAGVDGYRIDGGIKIVLYWHMALVREHPFAPNEEIDALEWLTRAEALRRLDHAGEQRLVRDVRLKDR